MNDNSHQDGIHPFPAGMQTREIETNGITVHVRVGGCGPAVVMLHGFGTTGDMWGHLANALIEDHTIVVPDLRGLGLSSRPDGGYQKKNQALDVVGVLDALGVRTAEFVTHDIGMMVGHAAEFPKHFLKILVVRSSVVRDYCQDIHKSIDLARGTGWYQLRTGARRRKVIKELCATIPDQALQELLS